MVESFNLRLYDPMINTLLFDFDGLILDTETPEFLVWQDIYRRHGQEFDPRAWGSIVGGAGQAHFDPVACLETLTGPRLERAALEHEHRTRSTACIAAQPLLPGALDAIHAAFGAGLNLAVASSSSHSWVDGHLQRLGLLEFFEAVICADDVPAGRTKPHPDLFLKALAEVHGSPSRAVVFEDSPNGIRAARSAGIPVVAVPNPFTRLLEMDGADLTLDSLADRSLPALLRHFGDSLEIRPERPGDLPGIRRVNREAFGRRNEAQAVDLIRQGGHASLSLAAALDGRVVGHILFTPVALEPARPGLRLLGIGPVAVRPGYQRTGVGSRLVRAGTRLARRQGVDALVLVGHPEYYPRFGFSPARAFGLEGDYGNGDHFMALELRPGALGGAAGKVHFRPELSETGC
ncbi:MAG: HAD-IA family hydrolase [Chloroflexi bacterium]|nr:HAD-IA family hydrolase [Chloroflexota bacterium]